MYQVPADLQAKLLIPLLTSRAKSVIGRMPAGDMEQYDELKKFLLADFKLTPREYKSRFDTAHKNDDETYVLFAARLRNLLSYYLRSRQVDNFDKLCELIVSDRLKAGMPEGPLSYVLSLEGNDWFTPDKVATLADIFVNNQHPSYTTQPRSTEYKTAKVSTSMANVKHLSTSPRTSRLQDGNTHENNYNTTEAIKRCYRCQSTLHLARNCPRGRGRGGMFRGYPNRAQVNFCSMLGGTHTNDVGVQCDSPDDGDQYQFQFCEYPVVDAVTTSRPGYGIKVSPLTHLDISVEGIPCKALSDSGAQIPIVSKRLFERCRGDIIGSINVQGVIGQTVEAPLVDLNVHLCTETGVDNITPDFPIVCAILDINAAEYDVILPAAVVEDLQRFPVASVSTAVNEVTRNSVQDNTLNGGKDENIVNIDNMMSKNGDVSALINEQKQDMTLSQCWIMAQEGKGGYVISRGLLFHNDKVEDQSVCQLCVPNGRRKQVMKLAHDSVFGGHMGERKTLERIRLSFHWPDLRQCVRNYVTSCDTCQLRSRVKTTDRVPITPVTRVDVPFQVLNMDCIAVMGNCKN